MKYKAGDVVVLVRHCCFGYGGATATIKEVDEDYKEYVAEVDVRGKKEFVWFPEWLVQGSD